MNSSRWSLTFRSARLWLIALLLLVAISCFYALGLPSTQAQGAMLKIHDIQGSGATSPHRRVAVSPLLIPASPSEKLCDRMRR